MPSSSRFSVRKASPWVYLLELVESAVLVYELEGIRGLPARGRPRVERQRLGALLAEVRPARAARQTTTLLRPHLSEAQSRDI